MMAVVKEKFARALEQWPVAIVVAGGVLTLLWIGALAWATLIVLQSL